MSPSIKKIVFSAVAMIFVLSACMPAQPTQSPVDPVEIENQVATAVALTVAAQNAQTQAAASLVPQPTNTTLPTQTEANPPSPTAIVPTETSTPIPAPTTASSGGGGGGTTIKPEYACNPFPRLPRDNTIFRPNDTFDIKWTIVNTGTKNMRAGLDVRFNSGTRLTQISSVELPELEPGDQAVIDFDAVAPDKEGTYVMTFIVEGGLCYPYTAIIVEKP
ncbi:MAG TPA: NBR1-Ig-like domain-containing protein [Anaerolineales bacterium]|nr:NBR1-Ig-like domain-containing protein [Anaerolineales bacterium]